MGIDDLAAKLWTARATDTCVQLDPNQQSLSIEDAYLVQQRYVNISGQTQTGWKVGATNDTMQTNLGLSEPFAGPLLLDTTLASPATCILRAGQKAVVEVEFVFLMGADVPAGTVASHEALANSIKAVCPGIEVAGTRYSEEMPTPSTALLIADAAANIALVQGGPVTQWQKSNLPEHQAQLHINGKKIDSGHGNKVLGNPLNSLAWLVGFLARYQRHLKRGDVITTGTVTDMHIVNPGDEIVADFGVFGEARVTIM